MIKMLHISFSPGGDASEPPAIASALLEAHPDAEVDTFGAWDGSLPEFGPASAPSGHLVPASAAGVTR